MSAGGMPSGGLRVKQVDPYPEATIYHYPKLSNGIL